MIVICPLSRLEENLARHRPSHLVSMLSAEQMIETPAPIAPERHLRLEVDNGPGACGADSLQGDRTQLEDLIAFVKGWDQREAMLIHCHAGVSRSTAAGFIALCALDPQTPEAVHAEALRQQSPFACPNERLVALGDDLLERDGRMLDALAEIGLGAPAFEGEPFALPFAQPAIL